MDKRSIDFYDEPPVMDISEVEPVYDDEIELYRKFQQPVTRRGFAAALAGLTVFGFPVLDRMSAYWRDLLYGENAENVQVWTTRDGRRVRICDMTDDHLRNTIFYFNKQYGYLTGTVAASYSIRESAREHAAERFLKGTPTSMHEIYDVMRREAQRRRLPWI